MKIRTIALAGAATLALSAPALADHVGWYLGLGVGYEQTQSTTLVLPPDPAIPTPSLGLKERFSGSGIYLVDAGYKFNRIEFVAKVVKRRSAVGGNTFERALGDRFFSIHRGDPCRSAGTGSGMTARLSGSYSQARGCLWE